MSSKRRLQLSTEGGDITTELKEKQARAKRLENEIQRIIAAEIRKSRERAVRSNIEEEAKRVGLVTTTNRTGNEALKELIEKKKNELREANKPVAEAPAKTSYELTPAASRLAANFTANKSLLPWPVERGIVVAKFGPYRHPVAKSVVLNNNGIDIATEQGSSALASFDGEVTSRFRIPGEGFVVFVKHGNYFTIYKNLSELFVKSGDQVKAPQELGKLLTNPK
ncbi:MAG: peptidoglycan DD-metalloendopeptidase family protein [Owenweeksia sp.]|nr:peptidoglycan DD-metalloendopeptidase family protein [Owenweeksia sp.]